MNSNKKKIIIIIKTIVTKIKFALNWTLEKIIYLILWVQTINPKYLIGVNFIKNVIGDTGSDLANGSETDTKAMSSDSNPTNVVVSDSSSSGEDKPIQWYHKYYGESRTKAWVDFHYYPHVNKEGIIINTSKNGSDASLERIMGVPLTRPDTPSSGTDTGYLPDSDSSGANTEKGSECSDTNYDSGSDTKSDSGSGSIANKTSLLIFIIFPLKKPSSLLLPFPMSITFWIRIIVITIQNLLG